MKQIEHENEFSRSGRRVFGCFGLVFGSFFPMAGLGMMISISYRALCQRSTTSWVKTQGEIVKIALDNPKEDRKSSPLTYKYKIDGRVYRSNVIVFVDEQNLGYDDWIKLADGLPEAGVQAAIVATATNHQMLRTPLSWLEILQTMRTAGCHPQLHATASYRG